MPSITLYQDTTAGFGASPLTTGALTAPASGNSWVVLFGHSSLTVAQYATLVVSDNQGNTYVKDAELLSGGNPLYQIWRCHNITNAPTTLTATWTGGGDTNAYFHVHECTGLANSAPTVPAQTGAFSATTVSSFSPASANMLLLGFMYHNGTFSSVTGVNRRGATTLNDLAYLDSTGAMGARDYGETLTASASWEQIFAFYTEAAGRPPIGSSQFSPTNPQFLAGIAVTRAELLNPKAWF